MGVWRPWDVDEDEHAARSLIREAIPDHLRPAVLAWIGERLRPSYNHVAERYVHALQSGLQIDLELGPGDVPVATLVSAVEDQGDRFLGHVVDFLLSDFEPDYMARMPPEVLALKSHLDAAPSALDITVLDGVYRLKHRAVTGMDELAEESRLSADGLAGQHLAKAWRQAFSLSPDTSLAMAEAVKAVEAAAHQLVTPDDQRRRLGKITQTIKDQPGWTLTFHVRDDGHPHHRTVLIGMLETLIIAQSDRHGGKPPSLEEARGHVQLASTLVYWFASGIVSRKV